MSDRRIDVFFYGLFMDEGILRASGVAPTRPRLAHADGYALRVGRRATLVATPGARAYGVVLALTHKELETLYSAPGLEAYRPEAILVRSVEDASVPVICYLLPEAPGPDETDPRYAARLREILARLGFPREYVESVA